MNRPLVLVSHGTADPAGQAVVHHLAALVRDRLPGVDVHVSHVSVQHPQVAAVLSALREHRAAPAVVVPVLLSVGYHTQVDVTQALAEQPGAVSTGALGPDPVLAQVLRERLLEAGARADDAVVMAVTGTSDPSGAAAATSALALLDWPGAVVGHLAAAEPTVADVVAKVRADRPDARVVAAPYLLAPGVFLSRLTQIGADLVAAPLGAHPRIADLVVRRYRAVVGE